MLKKGDEVRILPEFQDVGDSDFIWIVMADEEKGRVDVCPVNVAMKIKPTYTLRSHQVELVQRNKRAE